MLLSDLGRGMRMACCKGRSASPRDGGPRSGDRDACSASAASATTTALILPVSSSDLERNKILLINSYFLHSYIMDNFDLF